LYLFITVFDGDTRTKMLRKMATTPFALQNLSQLNTGPDDDFCPTIKQQGEKIHNT
jgi:hypothetical protein